MINELNMQTKFVGEFEFSTFYIHSSVSQDVDEDEKRKNFDTICMLNYNNKREKLFA